MGISDTLRVYVDLSSAYSYVGIHRTAAVAEAQGLQIDWRVIELAHIRQAIGTPSPLDLPSKLRHNGPDWARACADAGLPATPPAVRPVDADLARLLFYRIKRRDSAKAAKLLVAISTRAFGQGAPIGSVDDIAMAIEGQGLSISEEDIRSAANDETAAKDLAEANSAALQDGVFGAPFYLFSDIRLWGSDRIDMLDRLLSESRCPEGYVMHMPAERAHRLLGPYFVPTSGDAADLRMIVTDRHTDGQGVVQLAAIANLCEVAVGLWLPLSADWSISEMSLGEHWQRHVGEGAWLHCTRSSASSGSEIIAEVVCSDQTICQFRAHRTTL